MEVKDPDIILLGGRRHAEIESSRRNLDEALEWLDKVEPFLQQARLYRSRLSLLYRRARVLMLKGDYSAAEPLLERTVRLEVEQGGRLFLAADKFRLAEVYAATGRVQAARQLAIEARSNVEGIRNARARSGNRGVS